MPGPWKDARGIIVTTTPTIEGRPIQDYLGIVTGEVIVGANLFRDLFANIRDIVGGRSGSYERILAEAREQAIQQLQPECGARGGNAVALSGASLQHPEPSLFDGEFKVLHVAVMLLELVAIALQFLVGFRQELFQ